MEPGDEEEHLRKLCQVLNDHRVDYVIFGDGRRLEPRHIRSSSVAIGLVTRAGLVDLVVEPKGFESGFDALVRTSVIVDVGGTTVRVGALRDLITSKQLLGREKDREHLPLLLARQAEIDRERDRSDDRSRGLDDDGGLGLGF